MKTSNKILVYFASIIIATSLVLLVVNHNEAQKSKAYAQSIVDKCEQGAIQVVYITGYQAKVIKNEAEQSHINFIGGTTPTSDLIWISSDTLYIDCNKLHSEDKERGVLLNMPAATTVVTNGVIDFSQE